MKRITNITRTLLLVPAFLLALGFTATVVTGDTSFALNAQGGANSAQGDDTPSNLFDGPNAIFQTITNVLLFLIGAISVIMLIIGGIRYTISGGDSSQVTAAKNTILYSIVGIVVALLAFAIVNFVLGQFSA